MPELNSQWVLNRRPQGELTKDVFRLVETPLIDLQPGQFRVRVLYISIDPAQRAWLNDSESYFPPVALGAVMRATGVGEVVESQNDGFPIGSLVRGGFGWQAYATSDGTTHMGPVILVPPGVPPTLMLGALGLTGLTAYFGLQRAGEFAPGETVLVSAAAGATGSMVVQLAKAWGAKTVVGVAGGPEKCAWAKACGCDSVIDYKSEALGPAVAAALPQGADIYFDNVGGDLLEAAINNMAMRGRIVLCGGISSGYDQTDTWGPRNYLGLIAKRVVMRGFLVSDYFPEAPQAVAELAPLLISGQIKHKEDILDGLARAPEALARLFRGENFGKQLVRVALPS